MKPLVLHRRKRSMWNNETGATMVEYALLVTFIAMVAFAAVATFGTNLNGSFVSFAGLFP